MSSITELLNDSPKKVFNNFYKAQIKQIRTANKFTTMVQKANLKEQLSELQSQYKSQQKNATSKKDFNIFYKTHVKQIRDANKFTTMVKKGNLKQQISEQRSQYKEQQQIARTIAKEQKQNARPIAKEKKRVAKANVVEDRVHVRTASSVIAQLLARVEEVQQSVEEIVQQIAQPVPFTNEQVIDRIIAAEIGNIESFYGQQPEGTFIVSEIQRQSFIDQYAMINPDMYEEMEELNEYINTHLESLLSVPEEEQQEIAQEEEQQEIAKEVVLVECVYEVFQLESQQSYDEYVEPLPQDPDQIDFVTVCDLCEEGVPEYTCQQCIKCLCIICLDGVKINSRCCPFCKYQCAEFGNVQDFARETNNRLFQEIMQREQGGGIQWHMQYHPQPTQYQMALANMITRQGTQQLTIRDIWHLPESYEPYRQYDFQTHRHVQQGGLWHINLLMAGHAIALIRVYPVELSSIEAQQQYLTLPDYIINNFQQSEPRNLPNHLTSYFDGMTFADGRIIQNYYTAYNSFSQSIYNALEAQIPVQQVVPDILQNEEMESEEIDELESIMDVLINSEDDIIINASAGCGKTYTLRKIAEKIQEIYNRPKVAYIVFNQKNKQEASEFEEFKNVDIFTFNGFGKHQFENPGEPAKKYHLNKLNNNLKKIPEFMLLNNSQKNFVEKMVGLSKANGYGRCNSQHRLLSSDACGVKRLLQIQQNDPKNTVEIDCEVMMNIIEKALFRSQEQKNIIDFSDDIWLPVINEMRLKPYSIILFDESQDFNQVQIDLINMYKKQYTTRFIIVGDEFQSIYGFRGSTGDSIKILKDNLTRNHRQNRLQMRTLSTNYRCDKNIIEYVNENCEKSMKYAVDINVDSSENVRKMTIDQISEMITARIQEQGFTQNTVVVSNLNATVLQWVSRMYFLQVPINYNIEPMMKKIYKKYDSERPLSKLKLMFPDDLMTLLPTIMQELIDAVGDISVQEFIEIFKQDGGMNFMTIHKSKGLEYKNVIYIPIDQEKDNGSQECKNLEYIAMTRAKQYLYIFEEPTDLQAYYNEFMDEPGVREQFQQTNRVD